LSYQWKNNRRSFLTLLLSVLALAAALVIYKFAFTSQQPNLQESSRLRWWATGLNMFKSHPWLGVGLGNYPSAYLAFEVSPGLHTLYPHNYYIGLLAETGLIGFGAALFFFKTWARFLCAYAEQARGRFAFVVGIGLALLFNAVNIGF